MYSGDPTIQRTTTTRVPVVATEARKVHLESEDGNYEATGEIVSSQTISSKTRTVETITVSFNRCRRVIFVLGFIFQFDHFLFPKELDMFMFKNQT